MHRSSDFFEFKNAVIHYAVCGSGSKTLICFHGYGQSNEYFKMLEEVLGGEYVIYSFDLFYHGESFWHEKDTPLEKSFWNELIEEFTIQNKISTFDVLGFSMGGKFALATFEVLYTKINKVILIAPDGVKTSFWYNLATYPSVLRSFFRSMVVKPSAYFAIVKVLSTMRLVDKGVLRFANNQMSTRKQRRRVYYSWVVFRKLVFDINEIASIFNTHKIKLEMYLGEYDKIITLKNMHGLLGKVEDSKLIILKSGHSNLIDAVAEYLKKNK